MAKANEPNLLQSNIQQYKLIECDNFTRKISPATELLNVLHLSIHSIHTSFNNFSAWLEAHEINFTHIIVLGECWNINEAYSTPDYNSGIIKKK